MGAFDDDAFDTDAFDPDAFDFGEAPPPGDLKVLVISLPIFTVIDAA
jgi:hypothetical protein